MLARFRQAIDASLDHLESVELRSSPTIGEVSAGALLGYLDFRWPDREWRTNRPSLAAWFDDFERRASMAQTAHRFPAG